MAENNYLNFINNNPLYIHNKLEPLNETIQQISSKVQIDEDIFEKIINILKNREKEIYMTLGGGKEEVGKERMAALVEDVYTNNKIRKEVIDMTNVLFGKMKVPSVKINKDGSYNMVPLNPTFKSNGEHTIKRGTSAPLKGEEAQKMLQLYCDNWNKQVHNYNDTMNKILSLMRDSSIKDSNSIKGLNEYFKNLTTEFENATTNEYLDVTKLSDAFLNYVSKKGAYFGNIIGLFTEQCIFKFNENLQKVINTEFPNFTFFRGDDIPRQYTGSSTNAKADNIFIIEGNLENINSVTIPVSLKFRSDSLFKAHNGTLLSISELIANEKTNKGEEYSSYFKYLLVNSAYWQYNGMNKIDEIILKILNNYAYVFISGGEKQNPFANAVFISGTFFINNEYENYFFPTSILLEVILENLKTPNSNILTWSGLDVKKDLKIEESAGFYAVGRISDIKGSLRTTSAKRLPGNYSYEDLSKNNLIITEDSNLFEELSSILGPTIIQFNHNIITGEGRKGQYKRTVFQKGNKGVLI